MGQIKSIKVGFSGLLRFGRVGKLTNWVGRSESQSDLKSSEAVLSLSQFKSPAKTSLL